MLFLPPELLLKIFKNIPYYSPILRLTSKNFKDIVDKYRYILYKKEVKNCSKFLLKICPSAAGDINLIDRILKISAYIFILNEFAEVSKNEKLFCYSGENEKGTIVYYAYKILRNCEDYVDGRRKFVGDRDINLNNRLDIGILLISFYGMEAMLKKFKPPTWIGRDSTIFDEFHDRLRTKFFISDLVKVAIAGGKIEFIAALFDGKTNLRLESDDIRRMTLAAFTTEKNDVKRQKWFDLFYDYVAPNHKDFQVFQLLESGRYYLKYEYTTMPPDMLSFYLKRIKNK